jgi:hypothetical protein
VIPATVAAVTEGVLKTMFPTSLKSAIMNVLMAGVLLSGVALVASPTAATGQTTAKENEKEKDKDKTGSKWVGEWLFDGDADKPCAIFQQGRVLLLVNEDGELATGKITEEKKIITRWGGEEGLVGELVDEGKKISWGNGTTWKRP